MSAQRKRGLGRGLDALLGEPSAAVAATAPGLVRTLAVSRLQPNRFQPRSHFDATGLDELAESIRAQGIVQPIVVSPLADGAYSIIAGERRWRAAQLAGLTEVPVVVREVGGDQELLELALVENLQRSDLNPVEEGEAYLALSERFGLSQDEVAKRVGKARTTVTNMLRLLKLPAEILDYLRDGRLTAGQARPLVNLEAERQRALAQRAVEDQLSSRELERLARETQPAAKTERKRRPAPTEVHAAAAAEKLTRRLQTRVEILRRGNGGSIRIQFHSEDELIRLFDDLMSRGDTP